MARIETFLEPLGDIRSLPAFETRLILATRMWVVSYKLGRNPLPLIKGRLPEPGVASRFAILLEAIGSVWPEPVYVKAPCCSDLSYDELAIVQMIRLSARGDKTGFDQLLVDMVNEDARSSLYAHACNIFTGLSQS